ncbi:hypothetical protein PIB30_043491 [Stylosanthes scabra]|uniref:DUF4283 domain-containing protein n=1 Tax=Stylosanthes scabra TaxID=79078 RepID=A0ABU6QH23_9FABA|nr:hypothetical protein [Stylosanthes scabra]
MAEEENSSAQQNNGIVDEEAIVVYNEEDILDGIENCKTSLIGRLITNKHVNLSWIQNAMSNIWRSLEGFGVTEVRPKLYQFFFNNEADLERALRESPLLFRNAWLLVKRWERAEEQLEDGLDSADIKIQVLGLTKTL